jgi:hypothetical protein
MQNEPIGSRHWVAGVSVFGLPCLIALLGLLLAQPPRPVPTTAPATEFSAERAIEHSRRLAVEPRPAGSAALERARDYLVEQLKGFGWEVEVQETTVAGGHSASTVQNVLARLPGKANTRSFALVSHYDTVTTGPGAADDGAGVVNLLETARLLKARPALRNDIILVFTGDEECGMCGARAFAEHHWGQGVGAMVNQEARGTSGPSNMFETSRVNGWLIRELVRAGAPVFANSLMYEYYSRSPTDTDFTVLKRAGYEGYNFAFVGNIPFYHTMNDSAKNLSLRSLQHQGECVAALARHFGDLPEEAFPRPGGAESQEVYFNTVGWHLARYPASWSRPLSWISAVLLGAAMTFGLVKRRFKALEILAGVGAVFVASLVVALSTGVLVWLAYSLWGIYLLYNAPFYAVSLVVVTVAIMLGVEAWFSRRFSVLGLAAGALVWWLASVVLLEKLLPRGSYFAAWPLLFGSAGLMLWCRLPPTATQSARPLALMTAFVMPVLLTVGPGLQSLMLSCTVLPSPVFLPLLVLMLGTLVPQLVFAAQRCGRLLSAAMAAAGLATFGIGLGTNSPSASRPTMNGMSYHLDLDRQEAFWICRDRRLDEWTSQFFQTNSTKTSNEVLPSRARFRSGPGPKTEESGRDGERPFWRGPAPLVPVAEPALEVVGDQATNGARQLTLRLTSPRKVPRVHLAIPAPVQVLEATVNGKPLEGGKSGWSLDYTVFPRSGVAELDLKVVAPEELKITVTETSYELPDVPGIRPRPPHMIPRPNTLDWFEGVHYDPCMAVVKTFTIPAAR